MQDSQTSTVGAKRDVSSHDYKGRMFLVVQPPRALLQDSELRFERQQSKGSWPCECGLPTKKRCRTKTRENVGNPGRAIRPHNSALGPK